MIQNKLNRFSKTLVLCLLLATVTLHAQTQFPATNPLSILELPAEPHELPFIWRGDSMHGRWDAHAALLVPVTLPQCPKQFYMQFDLGSPYSMFYGPVLNTIREKYPQSVPVETSGTISNYRFSLGRMPVHAKEMVVKIFGSANINWQDTTSVTIIGTIGSDLVHDRFLLIDYPGLQMTTGAEVPPVIASRFTLSPFMYAAGRILLPANIRGKQQLLYFDTGSSAFGFMTDKNTSEQLAAPGSSPVAFKVNSWGKPLSAFTLPTNESILFGAFKIPLTETTYVEGVNDSMVQQMMKMGISGLTGNKLFLQSVLLLDVKNKRFGLRER